VWMMTLSAPTLTFPKDALGHARAAVDRALDTSGTRARLAKSGLSVFVSAEKKPTHDALADFHIRTADNTLQAEVWFFDGPKDLEPASIALALAEKGRDDMHTTQNGSFLVRVTGAPERVSAAVSTIAGDE